MGILSRLTGGSQPPPTPTQQQFKATHLQPDRDSAALDIVGEHAYQANLVSVAGPLTPEGPTIRDHVAALMLEPNNPYDSSAIAVYVSSEHAGYLSREDAVRYGPVLRWLAARGKILAADAYLTGGWRRSSTDVGTIGVVLHLGGPAECMAELLSADQPIRTDHPWPGQNINFTGDSHFTLGDVAIDRLVVNWYAMKAGLTLHERVTKKVQLVVLCDGSGLTANARKAAEYGIPSISEGEFWRSLGVPVTDVGRPVHGWKART